MIKELLKEAITVYRYLTEDDFDPFAHGIQPEPSELDNTNVCFLKFSGGNTKLDWPYLSLPAGYTCPNAVSCKSFAAKAHHKFNDGSSLKKASELTQFGCFAARAQAQYPELMRKHIINL